MKTEILKRYSSVHSVSVDWLWYPYIPYGKITIIQGDPGDGKSTMMMNLIAALSSAGIMPDGRKVHKPQNIIYQCSEDGIADTIKPRLERCGADCNHIAFIDEELITLTIDDEIIREAIVEFDASLLVIDPIQAYIGADGDITNATKVRKLMHRVSLWASMYDCAVVLIGHMNKKEGSRELYRGLGSIDLVAAARSVLQIEKLDDSLRRVKQIKNSLASKGKDVLFEITEKDGFRWIDMEEDIPEEVQETKESVNAMSKKERAACLLKDLLKSGPVPASEIKEMTEKEGISLRMVNELKKNSGIESIRREGKWFWKLPDGQV